MDFCLETLGSDESGFTTWAWDHGLQAREKAGMQIIGQMTVAKLNSLKLFNRIDLLTRIRLTFR